MLRGILILAAIVLLGITLPANDGYSIWALWLIELFGFCVVLGPDGLAQWVGGFF